jgi:CubicO group peptidase (beta-lactamase class C family)
MRVHHPARLFAVATLIMLFGALAAAHELSPGYITHLEKKITDLMTQAHVPGLSVAVIREGEIAWSGAFGVRSTATGEPVDENTMFEAASLSKPVTAYTVLRLVDQGIMDLDTPLAEYLPYPKLAGDERYRKLTARIVLTHTTGLPNWGSSFIRDPGVKFGYSGEGFLYLGRVAEKLTGLSLQDLARREVFEPLGMAHTSYVWNETYEKNGACGHDRHGQANDKRKRTDPNGGASLLSTARDYAVFVCAVLNGRGLRPETIREMISPHVKADDRGPADSHEKISWGWGWGIMPAQQGHAFWHWGNNGDLRGYAVAYPRAKEGVVFFGNSESLFTMAEPLLGSLFDEVQWAFDWLETDCLRDPAWQAQMAIEEAFLQQGGAAGLKKLADLRREKPALLDDTRLIRMAWYLNGREFKEEAVAVLKMDLEANPESLDAWSLLARFYMEQGKNDAALAASRKCLAIDPDNETARQGLAWLEATVQAEKKPVDVPPEVLRTYAGDYGPRHIRFREGSLWYQRDGRDEYRLVPMARDLFALEGYSPFRIRFVADDKGNVTKIEGIYLGGNRDESERDKQTGE